MINRELHAPTEPAENGTEQNSSPPSRARRRRPSSLPASISPTTLPGWYSALFGIIVVGLICYFLIFNPNQKQVKTLCLASSVMLLACFPMFHFLRRGSIFQIPVLEAHALFYALCFGFPAFLTIPDLMGSLAISELDLHRALLATLLGLVSLYIGYYGLGAVWFRNVSGGHVGDGIPIKLFSMFSWAACGIGFAFSVLVPQFTILTSLSQVAGLFYSLGFYGLLILMLEKKVGVFSRFLVLAFVLPGALLLSSGLKNGQLAGVVTLLCWVSLVILRTRRRVPLELLGGAFLIFLVLQPVKFYVRNLAWGEGMQLGPVQMAEAYIQGFKEVYGSGSAMVQQGGENFNNSFARIDHLATTAAILRDTPSRADFIHGASYSPLLTKWIPRALWPGKPEERFGNDWAQRYGYLGQYDSTTSFNLPWLPEMYMNFGWIGIIGVMLLIGILYRYLWQFLMSESKMLASYTLGIVFSQALVITECNLSLQLGNIIIFTVALWIFGKGLGLVGISSVPAYPLAADGKSDIT